MSEPLSPEELERLIRHHSPALRLFATQWTQAAEDVVQEAFIKLVRQRRKPTNVTAWLYRVVRNQAISMLRANRRRRNHESRAAIDQPLVAEQEADLPVEEVTSALNALDLAEREGIVARIWGGLAFSELSEVLGVSTATAHRRFQQALNSLRQQLGIPCLSNSRTTD